MSYETNLNITLIRSFWNLKLKDLFYKENILYDISF